MAKGISRGFTLIELIVVIVILGILAVTAAPRFMDISTDATKAVTKAEFAAYRSAVGLVHAKYLLNQSNPLDLNGTSMPMTGEGYPQGNGSASARCVDLWNTLLADPPAVTAATSFSAPLDAGWYYLAANQFCAYGKSIGGESFADGSMAHFLYYFQDFSASYGGINYNGSEGDVILYNAD